MSSLTASSSVSFPAAPALAHSLNSRGELGMFVNPYGCPCQTCRDYLAERSESPAPAPAPFGPQATEPALSSTTLEDMYREMRAGAPAPLLQRSLTLGVSFSAPLHSMPGVSVYAPPTPSLSRSVTGAGGALARSSSVAIEGWGGEERPLFGADLRAAPALARTVTGLGHAPSTVPEADEEDADGDALPAAPLPFPLRTERTDVDALMDGLRTLRAELQLQQDDVYSGETRSHDEMAAQDAEWEDLDRKIHAIEQVMSSFGAIFRTR